MASMLRPTAGTLSTLITYADELATQSREVDGLPSELARQVAAVAFNRENHWLGGVLRDLIGGHPELSTEDMHDLIGAVRSSHLLDDRTLAAVLGELVRRVGQQWPGLSVDLIETSTPDGIRLMAVPLVDVSVPVTADSIGDMHDAAIALHGADSGVCGDCTSCEGLPFAALLSGGPATTPSLVRWSSAVEVNACLSGPNTSTHGTLRGAVWLAHSLHLGMTDRQSLS